MRIWIWIQHDDPQHTNCCEISAAACTQSYSQVGEVNIPKMRIWITWWPSSKQGDRRFSNCGCEIHQSGWSRGGSTSCPLIQVWHRLPMTTSTFWHLVVSSAFCSHWISSSLVSWSGSLIQYVLFMFRLYFDMITRAIIWGPLWDYYK